VDAAGADHQGNTTINKPLKKEEETFSPVQFYASGASSSRF
jgi:hypothetical protein